MSDFPNLKSFSHKQWRIHVSEADGAYEIFNPSPNGEKQFCKIVPGKYGEPIIVAEPDLAFDPPASLTYLNTKQEEVRPDQKIARIICRDGPRLSLTNARNNGVEIKANDDGSIQVGEDQWWIVALFLKDKNRFRNYDAFCQRERTDTIFLLELSDLADVFCLVG